MSQDASVETLTNIVISLAQQVAARDAQLKSERANFVEELAAMKDQHEVMRTARDHALQCMEEVALQRDRFKDEVETVRAAWSTDVERVRMQGESRLAKEALLEVRTEFDREQAEWKRKIELLEQAAVHQANILSQARHEAADWQARYTTMVNESRRHTEEWTLQFSRIGNRLDQLAAPRTVSDSGSSPTVVQSDTLSSKLITETVSPPKHARIGVLSSKLEGSSAPNTSVPTNCAPLNRSLHPQNSLTNPGTHQSDGSSIIRASQKRTRPSPQPKRESRSAPRPSILSSKSALPADRVIITAHYEVKTEEDGEDSADCSLLDRNVYHSSLGSRESDEHEGGDEEPVPKRRKTEQKRRAQRVVDDDDDEVKHVVHMGDEDAQTRELGHESRGKDDFDEMAIGAEDNHKEVYGHRRVNVREINVRPRTPPYPANISNSSGSSSKKRKVAHVNGRPTVVKIKR